MYFDFIEKNHLRTIKLDANLKNKYYSDLNNISESWIGYNKLDSFLKVI